MGFDWMWAKGRYCKLTLRFLVWVTESRGLPSLRQWSHIHSTLHFLSLSWQRSPQGAWSRENILAEVGGRWATVSRSLGHLERKECLVSWNYFFVGSLTPGSSHLHEFISKSKGLGWLYGVMSFMGIYISVGSKALNLRTPRQEIQK